MIKVHQGSTRLVFIFTGFVVKIPNFTEYRLFLHGLLANMQEKQWSGRHPDLARVFFCDWFGFLLIMERADRVSNDINWSELKKSQEKRYKKDELREFLLSDLKPSNWGYRGDGRLVKIDYGN